ncbi:MAG TPA: chorismate-binding protein, partial [Symbiobacteriaceae bacterium]|nr:chorismate-binding protein [Symbiobacteriaceae bacterium]
APKVRAMQIIEELEPVRRGAYTGSIGYIGFDGRMDWSIAIRTVTVQDGVASFHVGGGIVADSSPEAEWAETMAKASGIARALGLDLGALRGE